MSFVNGSGTTELGRHRLQPSSTNDEAKAG